MDNATLDTQDEDKQNKKHNTENWKDDQYGPHRNPRENTDAHKNKLFLLLIHPACYSYSQDVLGTTIRKQTQIT